MPKNHNTILSDAERLVHWARRTLHSDRVELRDRLHSWCARTGVTINAALLAGVADFVHAQYVARGET